MAKAVAYGTRRWPALCCFLDDGRLEIDNNIAERALRGIAVGRRNWLFAGFRAGGERAAAIYTVIQTCKANGVDPQAYITEVIAKIAEDWPASRWDELMHGTGLANLPGWRHERRDHCRLHIVLNDIEPVIWRRVDVPVTASLKMFHDIVQAAMGWENYHLWHFDAGDRRYGVPDPMWPDSGVAAARNVKLAALIDREICELLYTYDRG